MPPRGGRDESHIANWNATQQPSWCALTRGIPKHGPNHLKDLEGMVHSAASNFIIFAKPGKCCVGKTGQTLADKGDCF